MILLTCDSNARACGTTAGACGSCPGSCPGTPPMIASSGPRNAWPITIRKRVRAACAAAASAREAATTRTMLPT
jgi:hypothetical protein